MSKMLQHVPSTAALVAVLCSTTTAWAQPAPPAPAVPETPAAPSDPASAPTAPSTPPAPSATPTATTTASAPADEARIADDDRLPRPEAERPWLFGRQGQWVLSGSFSLGISSQQYTNSEASRFNVWVSPGVDYFVIDNFSIGGDFEVSFSDYVGYDQLGSTVQTKTTGGHVGARVGYNVPLGQRFSIYPRAGFGVGFEDTSNAMLRPGNYGTYVQMRPNSSEKMIHLWAFAPILFHPVPHFFVGVGPSLSHEVLRENTTTTQDVRGTRVSAGFVMGGWF